MVWGEVLEEVEMKKRIKIQIIVIIIFSKQKIKAWDREDGVQELLESLKEHGDKITTCM